MRCAEKGKPTIFAEARSPHWYRTPTFPESPPTESTIQQGLITNAIVSRRLSYECKALRGNVPSRELTLRLTTWSNIQHATYIYHVSVTYEDQPCDLLRNRSWSNSLSVPFKAWHIRNLIAQCTGSQMHATSCRQCWMTLVICQHCVNMTQPQSWTQCFRTQIKD